MQTPEKYEKKKIKQFLDSIGAWHFSPFMAGYGKAGVSDIVFCYRGRFGAIEVKREGKLPTKLQELRMEEVRKAGGAAFWGTASKVISEIRRYWVV